MTFKKTKSSRRKFIMLAFFSGFAASIGSGFKLLAKNELIENSMLKFRNSGEIDWEQIRNSFLLRKERTYFNVASHGVNSLRVINRVTEVLRKYASSGDGDRYPMRSARIKISELLNVSQSEIALTRNTTESVNIIARGLNLRQGDEVIISEHEHIGGAAPWIVLKKELGITIKVLKLDLTGKKNLEILEKNLSSRTKVVYLSHITCTTGMCLPVKKIVALCKRNNIISCLDGAQAVGMIPVDLRSIDPDFYVSCGHKWLFGPQGTGILFVKSNNINLLKPTFVGSYSDSKFNISSGAIEFRKDLAREEYGTRNNSIYGGLDEAIDFVTEIGLARIAARGEELCNYFKNSFENTKNVEYLSPEIKKYSTYILTLRFRNRSSKPIVDYLSIKHNIRSRWIYECDLDAIRISFSIINSIQDVDRLVNAFNLALKEK